MARFSTMGCCAALSVLIGSSQNIACSSDGNDGSAAPVGTGGVGVSGASGSSSGSTSGGGGSGSGDSSGGGGSGASGRRSSGGNTTMGGAPAGGASNGGTQSSGATTGAGGSSSGGALASGGATSGGTPNSGGRSGSGGGSSSSGGSSSGGSCTCQSSGGASATGGSGGVGAAVPVVGGCPLFTSDDEWNRAVTNDSTDAGWTTKLFANATLKALHPDFGSGFGIPFNVVPNTQATLAMSFDYKGDSDPGPYPFPGSDAKIEGGTPTSCSGDCHVLTLEQTACLLYEGWNCHYTSSTNSWHCGSGAEFDLRKISYGQRPLGWTSADAAGLAILPGLVKYAEVAAGAVKHAIRFTMHCTQDGFVKPASHQAVPTNTTGCPAGISTSDLEANYPPMGLRIRLKAGYDISGLSSQAKVVAQAMKTYGMILADNGSDYFFQGDDDSRWDDNQLNDLKKIPGDAFDVVTLLGPIQR